MRNKFVPKRIRLNYRHAGGIWHVYLQDFMGEIVDSVSGETRNKARIKAWRKRAQYIKTIVRSGNSLRKRSDLKLNSRGRKLVRTSQLLRECESPDFASDIIDYVESKSPLDANYGGIELA